MAEKKPPPGHVISNAVRTERKSPGVPDRSRLSDILVKSPQWKKNVLGVGAGDFDSSSPAAPVSADPVELKASLLALIEEHWLELVTSAQSNTRPAVPSSSANLRAENDDSVHQDAEQLAVAQARRDREWQRLQERVKTLEAENALLTTRYEDEVNTRKKELLQLRAAFEQFERESDQLLSELDNQNEALRPEHPD